MFISSRLTNTYSKWTIKTLEKGVKMFKVNNKTTTTILEVVPIPMTFGGDACNSVWKNKIK